MRLETWYRATGDLRGGGRLPLIVVRGGPGATHDHVESVAALARDGRAVIHCDQIGCGRSTRLPDSGADFWTPALVIKELEKLITHLGLGKARLHKSAEGRTSPFPGQADPTASVTGMPRAVKPFRAATGSWNSAP